MPRIAALDPATTSGRQKELLDEVEKMFGSTPNLFRTAASSPAALEAMLRFFQAAGGGSLEPGFVEQIALAVSQVNGCSYCLSAHTHLGKLHKVADEELESSRGGLSSDSKKAAGLAFAQSVARERGAVSDADLAAARAAGWTEGEIVEVVANVALTTYTNLLAITADMEIDLPVVAVEQPALA